MAYKTENKIPLPSHKYVINCTKKLMLLRYVKNYYNQFDCPYCYLYKTKHQKLIEMQKIEKPKNIDEKLRFENGMKK